MSPSRTAYSYVLAEEVVAGLLVLPKRKQRQLAAVFQRLAAEPHRDGLHASHDEAGHTIPFHRFGDWLIGCWPDHAVREVRVVELERAD